MHGLINKGIQVFLTHTYGQEIWVQIADEVRLPGGSFEALLTYEEELTWNVLAVASKYLGKSEDTLLEDLGTYLVSHTTTEPVRRLLRFGGFDFADFLNSLDELPERARLAVPNLSLPELMVSEVSPDQYEIICASDFGRYGLILTGLLRAMADDYGSLCLIEWSASERGEETVSVRLLDGKHSAGRSFSLATEAAQ